MNDPTPVWTVPEYGVDRITTTVVGTGDRLVVVAMDMDRATATNIVFVGPAAIRGFIRQLTLCADELFGEEEPSTASSVENVENGD